MEYASRLWARAGTNGCAWANMSMRRRHGDAQARVLINVGMPAMTMLYNAKDFVMVDSVKECDNVEVRVEKIIRHGLCRGEFS